MEILLLIFRWSFDITTLQKDRSRLSLVCRYWRDVVQESACLWTDISGHDSVSYVQRSLVKSTDLPIDIHYLSHGLQGPQMDLPSYLTVVLPHLSRCRSISLFTPADSFPAHFSWFEQLFAGLRTTPATGLESLTLQARVTHRGSDSTGSKVPQLPGMIAFPRLRRLTIDGMPCGLSVPGLLLNNVRSLNLVDVINVDGEQLLEVLRNSPHLEWLRLGRSPVACPPQSAWTPIHLPHLMALYLIFMPIQVSNFVLTTIHAPNCSELVISSHFPELPEDVVRKSLFTSNTEHFAPVLQKLLTGGQYKDIYVIRFDVQRVEFNLRFHDEQVGHSVGRVTLRLDFKLRSVEQIEATAHWLVGCLNRDIPKIPIRLFVNGIDDVRVINRIDSNMAITHLRLRLRPNSNPSAHQPSPILVHMAQTNGSDWPLPDLEVFIYDPVDESGSQNEAMLGMLRSRYGSGPEQPDSERVLPRPLRRMRIVNHRAQGSYLLREAEMILPKAETSLTERYQIPTW